jgi:hypothetical protein
MTRIVTKLQTRTRPGGREAPGKHRAPSTLWQRLRAH